MSADPPDLFLCPRQNVLRGQFAVARRVPFLCQLRIHRRKVVLSNENLPPGADRTAAPGSTGMNACAPAVSFFAAPPDGSMTSGADVRRNERRIFPVVPLPRQLRMLCRQIVEANQHLSPRAVGAAGAGASCIDRSLPFVSVFTPPPGRSVTAVGNRLRRERQIVRRVPFTQQRILVILLAIVKETLPHARLRSASG